MTDGPTPTAGELRRRFASAFAVRPWIYWTDFLASTGAGWCAFAACLAAAPGSLAEVAAFVGAVLALYRALLFIHELAHVRRGALPGFEAAWNALAGLPLLVPSFMYVGSHLDHHRTASYGTPDDPEYEPIAHWRPWRIALSSLTLLAVPGLLVLRFGLLGPLSRLVPALRPTVVQSMSTLVINPRYRRRPPQASETRRWALEEAAAAVVAWAGVLAVATGLASLRQAGLWYALSASIALLNHVRTLAAHRYESRGARLDAAAQLRDSVNVVGSGWLTALAAPVGLRYHALHHLAPTLPYHSLGAVHRHLVAELPEDAAYRRAEAEGILASTRALFRRAGDGEAETALPPAR